MEHSMIAHLDKLDAHFGCTKQQWEVIERGVPLENAGTVSAECPQSAAKAYAEKLLVERVDLGAIVPQIRVRAPGSRLWSKFKVKITVEVENV